MPVIEVWHGDKVKAAILKGIEESLTVVGTVARDELRKVVGIPNTGVSVRRKRGTGDFRNVGRTRLTDSERKRLTKMHVSSTKSVAAERELKKRAQRRQAREVAAGRAAERGQKKARGNSPGTGTRTIYPNPSRPGEPPRKITGQGQQNIFFAVDPKGQKVKIGVRGGGIHLAYLELGTSRIAPRPWLLTTMLRMTPRLREIYVKILRGQLRKLKPA